MEDDTKFQNDKSKFMKLWSPIKTTLTDFSADECPMMAAALAYYTAFSLPPLLVLIVTVAGFIWSPTEVTGQVEDQVSSVIGNGGWIQIEEMMKGANAQEKGGWAAIIGIIMLIFGATGVMIQLQTALNKTWEVTVDPDQGGIMNFITKRLLSIAMIMTIAFLLLVSLALTAFFNALAKLPSSWLPDGFSVALSLSINFGVSLVVLTILFAAMFKWLPDAHIQWRETWLGAAFTALLFMIGKFALGLYFGMADTGRYGAAASFILLLLWVYYSGMIFLFGAEFIQVMAKLSGRRIVPEKGAVRVIQTTQKVPDN